MLNLIQRRLESGAQYIALHLVKLGVRGRAALRTPVTLISSSALLGLIVALLTAVPARAADTLNWETNRNRVSADIKSGKLLPLLEQIAAVTRWHVFVEPDTTHTVSAKFSNLPPGEALRLLLGDLNFALVPETNASPKLVVFRTVMKNATQIVRPVERRRGPFPGQSDSQRADSPAQAGGED